MVFIELLFLHNAHAKIAYTWGPVKARVDKLKLKSATATNK